MKKLMIAACAVALAVGAQAAAVTWAWAGAVQNGYKNSGDSSTTYDGKAAQAGTMYLFNALATDKDSKTINQQYVLTALLGGSDIADLGAIDNYTSTDGKMGSKKTLASDYASFAPVRWDAGKSANFADVFYAMVVGDNVFVSDTLSMAIQTSKDTNLSAGTMAVQSAKFKGDAKDGFTAGGWYAMSVPEPTSGLLMLIGVAGLALRRGRRS